jgi:AraC-like DNA-binding protein
MKPQHLKLAKNPSTSFSVRQDKLANINNRWHYHSEVELIHFHKGSGTQFIGDHIKGFAEGDIVLVGANLPHFWKYENYIEDNSDSPYSTVVHFDENFWGEKFLNLPETKIIRNLLDKARRGILLSRDSCSRAAFLISKICKSEGITRIVALIECLVEIANSHDSVLLSSLGFQYDFSESENERLNAIYDFTFKNFKDKILLEEVAELAGLVPNSFCRYFKSRTGKTYSQFLIELRVGYACKLIIENKINIKQLCFESGFNNFSCFHKNFKKITGKSPKDYQNQFS